MRIGSVKLIELGEDRRQGRPLAIVHPYIDKADLPILVDDNSRWVG